MYHIIRSRCLHPWEQICRYSPNCWRPRIFLSPSFPKSKRCDCIISLIASSDFIIIYDWNIVLFILHSFLRTWHHILQTVSSMHLAWLAPRDSAVHTHSFASASQSPEKIIGIFGIESFFWPNFTLSHQLNMNKLQIFLSNAHICTIKISKSLVMSWDVVALILKRAAYA